MGFTHGFPWWTFCSPWTLTAGIAGFSHLCRFLHLMVWILEKCRKGGGDLMACFLHVFFVFLKLVSFLVLEYAVGG